MLSQTIIATSPLGPVIVSGNVVWIIGRLLSLRLSLTKLMRHPSRILDRLEDYEHDHGEADESHSSVAVVLDRLQSDSQTYRTDTRWR